MTVFNFGSINIDHVYRVPHFVQPGETLSSLSLETVLGGKGANQSVALARAGASVKHLGRISESDRWAIDALAECGVDVCGVEMIESPSGHAIIQVNDNGENAIVLHGGANQSFDQLSLTSLLKEAQAGDWLLLQNECNALAEAFAIAQTKQMNIAFNPAPMDARVETLPLEKCNVLIVNEVEAAQLLNVVSTDGATSVANNAALHKQLQQRFPDASIVLTLGAQGAMLFAAGRAMSVEAPIVNVIDSTGAGDTFVGYFLSSLINGLSAEQALERACAAGALAVTVAGATPGIPVDAAVKQFMKGQ